MPNCLGFNNSIHSYVMQNNFVCLYTEIISIGLDEPAYQVNESSGFLQVCVQVLEENITLDRPVSVNITTLAVTATGS